MMASCVWAIFCIVSLLMTVVANFTRTEAGVWTILHPMAHFSASFAGTSAPLFSSIAYTEREKCHPLCISRCHKKLYQP